MTIHQTVELSMSYSDAAYQYSVRPFIMFITRSSALNSIFSPPCCQVVL